MKKKVHIEYPLNPSSSNIIWGIVSTAAGLQRWFADRVNKAGKTYTFQWGKQKSVVQTSSTPAPNRSSGSIGRTKNRRHTSNSSYITMNSLPTGYLK